MRKKQVKKLRKVEHRKWSLKYLTEIVGRGSKAPLKVVNPDLVLLLVSDDTLCVYNIANPS